MRRAMWPPTSMACGSLPLHAYQSLTGPALLVQDAFDTSAPFARHANKSCAGLLPVTGALCAVLGRDSALRSCGIAGQSTLSRRPCVAFCGTNALVSL